MKEKMGWGVTSIAAPCKEERRRKKKEEGRRKKQEGRRKKRLGKKIGFICIEFVLGWAQKVLWFY
ncbi:hypothetical protein Hanom_Chr11g01058051 [Helianthus anomalus]